MKAAGALRVIGIDPGTRVVGYGLIEYSGGRERALAHGVIRAPARLPAFERLGRIAAELHSLVEHWQPDEAGIEEAFHGRDARAALRIGEARGALVSVLARAGVPVSGYANNVVKKAVSGAGRASKAQVQTLVTRILGLAAPPEPEDASDALAVAICHVQHRHRPGRTPGDAALPPRLAEALKRAGASRRHDRHR